jgi:hypothetical protein
MWRWPPLISSLAGGCRTDGSAHLRPPLALGGEKVSNFDHDIRRICSRFFPKVRSKPVDTNSTVSMKNFLWSQLLKVSPSIALLWMSLDPDPHSDPHCMRIRIRIYVLGWIRQPQKRMRFGKHWLSVRITAKKPRRNLSDSDVDNGCNRPIYRGVGNFLLYGRWSVTVHALSTSESEIFRYGFFCRVPVP